MNKSTMGTCSICGGRVSVPAVWWSVIPPTPTCELCGAIPLEAHGPVIPMRPSEFGTASNLRFRITGTSWERPDAKNTV
jgi:hypothetical protein